MPRTKTKPYALDLDRWMALEIERLAKEGERTPEQQIRFMLKETLRNSQAAEEAAIPQFRLREPGQPQAAESKAE
jgi:hypothetical protein